MPTTPKKLAVFVSGAGTLLEFFLSNGLQVDLVLADRQCRGIDIAKEKNIPTELVLRTDFGKNFNREAYTKLVLAALKKHEIDVVAMAGFDTVLSPSIFDEYAGKILNTHPALLPAFKGLYGCPLIKETLAYGVKVTGCTIHIATAEVDVGKILAQKAVGVLPNDTEDSLWERIKEVERPLYLETIRAFMADKL